MADEMNQFRTQEIITLSDLFLILSVTIVLLIVTFVILKRIKPSILRQLDKKNLSNIEIIERRQIPYLGQVSIVLINKEQFVVVQTKTGVAMSPLKNAEYEPTIAPENMS